ncbi:hypothetical protein Hanom_Chr02g00106121 [Helianthus anomalus]
MHSKDRERDHLDKVLQGEIQEIIRILGQAHIALLAQFSLTNTLHEFIKPQLLFTTIMCSLLFFTTTTFLIIMIYHHRV